MSDLMIASAPSEYKEALEICPLPNKSGLMFFYGGASVETELSWRNVMNIWNLKSADRGKGHASALMDYVTKYADEMGFTLTLNAYASGGEDGLNQKQLMDFYKRKGFVFAAYKFGAAHGVRKPKIINQ